jgi:hypothetical protein
VCDKVPTQRTQPSPWVRFEGADSVWTELKFDITHPLSVVLRLALPVEPLWATLTQPLIDLTDWAVLPRYPGTTAGPADARQAVKTCRRFREAARLALGL